MLWCFLGSERVVLRVNNHVDTVPMEGRERILQPNAELPDDRIWAFEFLLVFCLREVIISKSSTEISNVPPTLIILGDIRLFVSVSACSSRALAMSSRAPSAGPKPQRTSSIFRSNFPVFVFMSSRIDFYTINVPSIESLLVTFSSGIKAQEPL